MKPVGLNIGLLLSNMPSANAIFLIKFKLFFSTFMFFKYAYSKRLTQN